MGLVKQLTVPSWHTRPSPSTSTLKSSVSLSQSVAAAMTRRRLPLVSPFIHSFWRVRLQKVTKPDSRVLRSCLVEEAEHEDFSGPGVLDNAGNEAVHFCKVNLCEINLCFGHHLFLCLVLRKKCEKPASAFAGGLFQDPFLCGSQLRPRRFAGTLVTQ